LREFYRFAAVFDIYLVAMHLLIQKGLFMMGQGEGADGTNLAVLDFSNCPFNTQLHIISGI
jgi:hypothetical protein